MCARFQRLANQRDSGGRPRLFADLPARDIKAQQRNVAACTFSLQTLAGRGSSWAGNAGKTWQQMEVFFLSVPPLGFMIICFLLTQEKWKGGCKKKLIYNRLLG